MPVIEACIVTFELRWVLHCCDAVEFESVECKVTHTYSLL